MPGQLYRRRARERQSGAAAVEFALVSMLLFTLLFGIIQYGFYFWAKQAGSAAVREAARQAAVGKLPCDQFETFVGAKVGPVAQSTTVDATRSFATSPAKVGDTVELTVTFRAHDLHMPFIPLPANAEVVERAETRVENVTDDSVNCS